MRLSQDLCSIFYFKLRSKVFKTLKTFPSSFWQKLSFHQQMYFEDFLEKNKLKKNDLAFRFEDLFFFSFLEKLCIFSGNIFGQGINLYEYAQNYCNTFDSTIPPPPLYA